MSKEIINLSLLYQCLYVDSADAYGKNDHSQGHNKPRSEAQLQQIQKRALLGMPENLLTFECPNANDDGYEGSKILLGA